MRNFAPLAHPKGAEFHLSVLSRTSRDRSAVLFTRSPRRRASGCDDDVAEVLALVVDLDPHPASDASWPRLLAFTPYVQPFAVVASGSPGHGHIYFRLNPPEIRFDLVTSVTQRLQMYLCADGTGAPSHFRRL